MVRVTRWARIETTAGEALAATGASDMRISAWLAGKRRSVA
jgi:hypothetical protein